MKRLLLSLALLTAAFALAAPDAGGRATVVAIGLGQVKVLPVPAFERMVLEAPELAALALKSERELAITGLRDGTTTLWVYRAEGNPTSFQLVVGTGRALPQPSPWDGGMAAIQGRPIELGLGAEMLVRTGRLEGLALVDPEVAEASIVSESLLRVRGLSPGTTLALAFPRDGGLPTSYPVTVSAALSDGGR